MGFIRSTTKSRLWLVPLLGALAGVGFLAAATAVWPLRDAVFSQDKGIGQALAGPAIKETAITQGFALEEAIELDAVGLVFGTGGLARSDSVLVGVVRDGETIVRSDVPARELRDLALTIVPVANRAIDKGEYEIELSLDRNSSGILFSAASGGDTLVGSSLTVGSRRQPGDIYLRLYERSNLLKTANAIDDSGFSAPLPGKSVLALLLTVVMLSGGLAGYCLTVGEAGNHESTDSQ
ncbi:MAG: hypothetical protein ACYC1U_03705 [Candidatus Aquicultorales bacterium]